MELSRRQLLAGAAALAPQRSRPNLLFVFSDQQSYDMLGCYGNRQIITPHIDRFAQQAVRFNHCISNSPVCTPYRGLLLSGQHPLRTGALANDLRMVPGEGKYFAEVLRDSGYRMGYIGKWHLYGGDRVRPIPAGPLRYGFDGAFLSNNCTLAFGKDNAYYWDQNGERKLYGDWEPYAQTRQALEFLDRTGDQPFALFVSWHPPHNWQGAEKYPAPPELRKQYNADSIRVRANCEDTAERRDAYAGHMAMCTSLDICMGLLLRKLEDQGLADNTIVIYTSDHGDLLMSHGLRRNKGRVENESMHVPLLVRWPGKLKPRSSNLMIGALDLMPTVLGMIGIDPPSTCQGRNLAPAIQQQKDTAVESIPLFLLHHDWRGIYTRRYTYSFTVPSDTPNWWHTIDAPAESFNRLFDRQSDPLEMRNLFHEPAYQGLKKKLHAQTLAWMKKFEDDGLSYAAIVSKVEDEADLIYDKQRLLTQKGNGLLKGRPIDFLRKQQ